MCGRYTLIRLTDFTDMFPWIRAPLNDPGARYNIAPTQPIAVIANDGKNQIDFYRWGLIPSWAKDESIGSRMINARAETLAEKPSFKTALKRRRCLIPASGFYEWRKDPGGKTKTPMYIRLKGGRPFAFAGLWESWHSPEGSEIRSCTIITGTPNSLVKGIHDRMAVVLRDEDHARWIDSQEHSPDDLLPMLTPYPADQMEAYPVSRAVNSPANQGDSLIKPAENQLF